MCCGVNGWEYVNLQYVMFQNKNDMKTKAKFSTAVAVLLLNVLLTGCYSVRLINDNKVINNNKETTADDRTVRSSYVKETTQVFGAKTPVSVYVPILSARETPFDIHVFD